MAIRYLYLDDEPLERVAEYISAVEKASQSFEGQFPEHNLTIEIGHPAQYNSNIDALIQQLHNFHGLILDWRLDVVKQNSEVGKFMFRAGALAQEIRTRMTESLLPELPIVLWSTDERLGGSYKGDDTSHDLFDRTHLKKQVSETPITIAHQLLSLAFGYTTLRELTDDTLLKDALSLDSEPFERLDIRFRESFSRYQVSSIPRHEVARFLLRELLKRPGLLINESLMAAILGIDIGASEDWELLKSQHLVAHAYTGVFCEAWSRWWFGSINEWWRDSGASKSVSRYTAEERIEILKEYTELAGLVAAKPVLPHYSTRYDTVCVHYDRPLDRLDGVLVDEPEPRTWQHTRYLSLDAVLSRKYMDDGKWKPHPTEVERLREIRAAQ